MNHYKNDNINTYNNTNNYNNNNISLHINNNKIIKAPQPENGRVMCSVHKRIRGVRYCEEKPIYNADNEIIRSSWVCMPGEGCEVPMGYNNNNNNLNNNNNNNIIKNNNNNITFEKEKKEKDSNAKRAVESPKYDTDSEYDENSQNINIDKSLDNNNNLNSNNNNNKPSAETEQITNNDKASPLSQRRTDRYYDNNINNNNNNRFSMDNRRKVCWGCGMDSHEKPQCYNSLCRTCHSTANGLDINNIINNNNNLSNINNIINNNNNLSNINNINTKWMQHRCAEVEDTSFVVLDEDLLGLKNYRNDVSINNNLNNNNNNNTRFVNPSLLNTRCLRCGQYGHLDCPTADVIAEYNNNNDNLNNNINNNIMTNKQRTKRLNYIHQVAVNILAQRKEQRNNNNNNNNNEEEILKDIFNSDEDDDFYDDEITKEDNKVITCSWCTRHGHTGYQCYNNNINNNNNNIKRIYPDRWRQRIIARSIDAVGYKSTMEGLEVMEREAYNNNNNNLNNNSNNNNYNTVQGDSTMSVTSIGGKRINRSDDRDYNTRNYNNNNINNNNKINNINNNKKSYIRNISSTSSDSFWSDEEEEYKPMARDTGHVHRHSYQSNNNNSNLNNNNNRSKYSNNNNTRHDQRRGYEYSPRQKEVGGVFNSDGYNNNNNNSNRPKNYDKRYQREF